MAKKVFINNETIIKWAKIMGYIGTPIGIATFAYLISAGFVSVGSYESNQYCGGDVPCYLILHDMLIKKEFYLNQSDFTTIINARPTDSIEKFTLQIKDDKGKWQTIDPNKYCNMKFCGSTKDNKMTDFTFKFTKGKKYDVKIEVIKSPESTINWNINPSGTWYAIYEMDRGCKTVISKEIKYGFSNTYNTTNNGTIILNFEYIPLMNITYYNIIEINQVLYEEYNVTDCNLCDYSCINLTCKNNVTETIITQYNITDYVYDYKENIECKYDNPIGITINVYPDNESKYIDFVKLGVTGSMNYPILTLKLLSRGGTWDDKDLNSCYNNGVPCKQFNISDSDNWQIIKNIKDIDGVFVNE